jgi:lysophospholipase L1-like esterase
MWHKCVGLPSQRERNMAAQLSFEEFDRKMREGKLTPSECRGYLEIDPAAGPVRVRFKPGALRDEPPPDYDIDHQVYLSQRARQDRQLAELSLKDLPRVTADGDSWFNLPFPGSFCPPAIGNDLEADQERLVVDNVAHWGDTIATIAHTKRYVASIRRTKPTWFLISGGGNDLQQALQDRRLLEPYEKTRPIDQCISQSGQHVLESVGATLRAILAEVNHLQPSLKIICYAYDFPRPTLGQGKYLGRYLKEQHYPKTTWDQIAHLLIDKLTVIIQSVVAAFPNVQFLDCRSVTAKFTWWNDMHPEKEGFAALANAYERAMGVVLRIRGAAVRVKPKKSRPKKPAKKRAALRRRSLRKRPRPKRGRVRPK